MPNDLGNAVHVARKQAGLTLQQVGAKIEASAGLLSLIEQGKHVPPREMIAKLARLLGADADIWCGLAGKVTVEAEKQFARIARENPSFYRTMLSRRRE